jgi:hypothetical protein
MGRRVPLGFERLRVCELFAELLHLSNMSLLNTLLISNVSSFNINCMRSLSSSNDTTESRPNADSAASTANTSGTVTDTNVPTIPKVDKESVTVGAALKLKFIETGILPTCLDLFFNFPWNNFLHTVVYDMVHQVLNLPLDVGCNRHLIESLFCDAHITQRITSAQRRNDMSVEQPKGVRLGFMGHLTFIADQVVRLLERSGKELGPAVAQYCAAEDWQEYVSKTLRETKERDHQQLGGQRPSTMTGLSMLNLVGDDDEDDEDDEDDAHGSVSDLASDQVRCMGNSHSA